MFLCVFHQVCNYFMTVFHKAMVFCKGITCDVMVVLSIIMLFPFSKLVLLTVRNLFAPFPV